jgi:hypothetical protein
MLQEEGNMNSPIWGVLLGRIDAFGIQRDMDVHNNLPPLRVPRRRLRELLGRVLAAAGRWLVRLADRLAPQPRPHPSMNTSSGGSNGRANGRSYRPYPRVLDGTGGIGLFDQ